LESDAISLGYIDLDAPAPVAFSDTASTAAGTSVVIDVLKNDVDLKNLVMKVDGTTQPVHGTVTQNADGTLTYKPDTDFTGVEIFKYWVTDKNGKFDDGMVTVTVGAGTGTGGSHGGDTPGGQDHDGHDHPDVPPEVPGPPTTPLPAPPGHGHDPGGDGAHHHDDHGHHGHDHDPGAPPVVPAPPTSPLPPTNHAHDHDDRVNDRDPGHAHNSDVPPVPEISPPPANPPAAPVFDRAGVFDFRSWQQINVQLGHNEQDQGTYGAEGRLKVAAGGMEAYPHARSGYDLLSSPSAVYGEDFGFVRNVVEHFERAAEHLSSDHAVVAQLSMANTLILQLERSAFEVGLPLSDSKDSAFSFRDLGGPYLDASHHVGTEMRPQVEHLGGVASGFIFG
jgi:hypothetical protein